MPSAVRLTVISWPDNSESSTSTNDKLSCWYSLNSSWNSTVYWLGESAKLRVVIRSDDAPLLPLTIPDHALSPNSSAAHPLLSAWVLLLNACCDGCCTARVSSAFNCSCPAVLKARYSAAPF